MVSLQGKTYTIKNVHTYSYIHTDFIPKFSVKQLGKWDEKRITTSLEINE